MKSRFIWGVGTGLFACVFACLWAGAVSAHHSFAMFDPDKSATISGTVKEFEWTNPHVWVELTVTKGANQTLWSLEGPSVNVLVRSGWKAKMLKPGDKVTLDIRPRRDGKPGGAFIAVTFPDGRKVAVGGSGGGAGSQTVNGGR